MKKTYAGVILTFVVFAFLLSSMFNMEKGTVDHELVEDMNEDTMVESAPMAAVADTEMMEESDMVGVRMAKMQPEGMLVDDDVIEESKLRTFFSGMFGILVLSFMFTMLSWTVAEEVVRKRKAVLVNFKDAKGKKVMQALANKTCQEILEVLSKKKMTASELAEKIGMSAPRIHYNIKLLLAAELIEAKEFNYSEKGKEMDVYTLTKMHFMIGPEE